jgi:hypothetical protein
MRPLLLIILALSLVMVSWPTESLLEEKIIVKSVDSALTITFTNGPDADDVFTGLNTLTFSISGSGTLVNLQVEISADSTIWNEVENMTSTPWLMHLDSTQFTNGSYSLRTRGWDSDVSNYSNWFISNDFTIANQIPIITSFSVLNPDYGSGVSNADRAWFDIEETGTLSFSWAATDDDLTHAGLVNVPGSGSVPNDGPGTLAYGWLWSPSDLAEGTYNPRITVYDSSGLSASQTLFMGIDRTPPTMASPTIGNGKVWQDSSEVLIDNILSSADDGSGSGIANVKLNQSGIWTIITTESTTLNLIEGQTIIGFKAVDLVGNEGDEIQFNVRVDITDPEGIGWTVDELTSSKTDVANVAFSAYDGGSGIDLVESNIEYGFDYDGIGTIPDISGAWLSIAETGLSGTIGLTSWATKSRQYLVLRATLVDEAGNEFITIPAAFQILPGKDVFWNVSQTTLDKLVVKPGENTGKVQIDSRIETNEAYGGALAVWLEAAPADRDADVQWTLVESQLLAAGSLSDMSENLTWNYTVSDRGQWDLRLVIDPSNFIDERDEGNNAHYLVVTGASLSYSDAVPSFAPSIVILLLVGFALGLMMKKRKVTPLPTEHSHQDLESSPQSQPLHQQDRLDGI